MVAGGGIVGTWHALELTEAGFEVDHLEADAAPTGASVRNFGLIWVSGRRSGEELEVARRARRRWEEIGAVVPGIGFRAMTSLTVATDTTARDVMAAFAAHPDAPARGISFLEPDDVRACNPAIRGDIDGALHCTEDAVVEPRLALGALRDHMAATYGARYRFHPGHRVAAAEPHALSTRHGGPLGGRPHGARHRRRLRPPPRHGGARVPPAPRPAADGADGAVPPVGDDVAGRRRHAALLPGLRVGAAGTAGGADTLAAAHHLQLLVVQRPDGGLTIGDTHAYGEPFDFALCEDPTRELLARAERILGAELPRVQRRWEGVYAQCVDGAVCLRQEIEAGVWLVTDPGGRGMTCSPAIAADTLRAAGVAP